jgi:rSAM/selenodomain-associated transferase 1
VKAAIIIGTDCPELTDALLTQAFQALQQTALVLGPATDGGYYLIGLRQMVPDLFQSIAWSTDRVFQQTVMIARNLNLSISALPTLTDVDRPEDLPVWEQATRLKRL